VCHNILLLHSPKTSAESTSNANLIAERQLVATAVANLKGTVSGTTNACTEYRQDHALDQLLQPASRCNLRSTQ